jgi:hypothetical protein
METWGVVFLGAIAVSSVVQSAFLVALALAGLRLARRLDALQEQLDHKITPTLRDLERISHNAADVSDLATGQARRLDVLLADTLDKVEDTAAIVQRLVIRPLRPVSHIVAVLKGLQAGIDVFLHLERRESPPPAPSKGRTGEEDEHLFI